MEGIPARFEFDAALTSNYMIASTAVTGNSIDNGFLTVVPLANLSVTSDAIWIQNLSIQAGVGVQDGFNIVFDALENTTGADRVGNVTITINNITTTEEITFSVTQAGV